MPAHINIKKKKKHKPMIGKRRGKEMANKVMNNPY